MYRPSAHAVDDPATTVAMIRQAGFGHLVVDGADGLDAVPLPVLVDDDGDALRVRAHVAKANPLWRAAPCSALLIVPLTDAYVSPGWYPSKRDDPRVVPTWNYEVVHVHGTIHAHTEPEWLETIVRDLTARHEADLPTPWSVDDAPAEYVARLLGAIVGIELVVERLEGKRKLSQNRSADDAAGVVTGLNARGDDRSAAVARAMSEPLS